MQRVCTRQVDGAVVHRWDLGVPPRPIGRDCGRVRLRQRPRPIVDAERTTFDAHTARIG